MNLKEKCKCHSEEINHSEDSSKGQCEGSAGKGACCLA